MSPFWTPLPESTTPSLHQVVTDASVFNPRGDEAARIECETLLHRSDGVCLLFSKVIVLLLDL